MSPEENCKSVGQCVSMRQEPQGVVKIKLEQPLPYLLSESVYVCDAQWEESKNLSTAYKCNKIHQIVSTVKSNCSTCFAGLLGMLNVTRKKIKGTSPNTKESIGYFL